MKKTILSALMIFSFACSSFAMDEDAYVRFVADSIVVAHKFKGDPDAANRWAEEVKSTHPDVTAQDLTSYEGTLASDSVLKDKVYNRILEVVRARGYKAHISNLGTGATTVEIED